MDGPVFDFDKQLQALVEETDERQASVASCMKKAGFDYTPLPYGGAREPEPNLWNVRAAHLMVPQVDPNRDVVAKWGYGVEPESAGGADALAPPGADTAFDQIAAQNDASRESLGASQREAYDETLYGPVDEDGHPVDPEGGGCAAQAYADVPQVAGLPEANKAFNAAHEGLLYELVELTKWDLGMDPRAVTLDQEWERCTVRKGLDFSVKEYPRDGDGGADVSMANRPSPMGAFDIAHMVGKDGQAISDKDVGIGQDAFALQAYPAQVEVALADFDCREEIDYMDRLMAILFDVEQRFLDENKDRLEALTSSPALNGGDSYAA
jgi:hypothetical protein